MEIVTSWMEEGIEIGRRKGTVHVLLIQLNRLLGPLPTEIAARISSLEFDALDRLTDKVFDFSTLAELERWLANEGG